MDTTQPKSEAEQLLEWLDGRHSSEVAEYRFVRDDSMKCYFLHADNEVFMGESFADCLRQAKEFLKPPAHGKATD